MLPNPHPASAAAVLTGAHATLTAALGVTCLIAWYITHRHAAHRHPVAEVIAKILLVVGGVILAVTVGVATGWITAINDTTAGWFASRLNDPTFTTHHLGLLTLAAWIDVAFVTFTTYDLIRKALRKRQASAGSQGGPVGGARGWGAAEVIANKYGWFGLGPLSVTLPGAAGVWVLTILTMLAESVGHFVGLLFGLG